MTTIVSQDDSDCCKEKGFTRRNLPYHLPSAFLSLTWEELEFRRRFVRHAEQVCSVDQPSHIEVGLHPCRYDATTFAADIRRAHLMPIGMYMKVSLSHSAATNPKAAWVNTFRDHDRNRASWAIDETDAHVWVPSVCGPSSLRIAVDPTTLSRVA